MLKLTLRAALGALIAVMAVLATPALAFDHQPWDDLLQAHVSKHRDGVASAVDYDGMAADQAALDDYLARLSAVEFEDVLAAAKLTQHAEAFRKVGFADARDLVSATTASTRLRQTAR